MQLNKSLIQPFTMVESSLLTDMNRDILKDPIKPIQPHTHQGLIIQVQLCKLHITIPMEEKVLLCSCHLFLFSLTWSVSNAAEEEFNPTIHSEGIKLVNKYRTERTERPHQIHSTSQQHDLDDPMPTYQNNSHGGIKLVSRYGSGDSQRSRQTIPNNTMPIPPNYSQYHSSPGPSYSQKPHQTLNTSQYPEPNSPMPIAPNYSQNHPVGPSYQPSQTPPPPPPPSNVGYISNYFPSQDHYRHSYVNMQHSGAPPPGLGAGAGFGMGLGAGALAAGAMIFGDDFMSGFNIRDPSGHTANPPF